MDNLVKTEDFGTLLTIFLESYKDEIFEFFNRCYSYIKDLFKERDVDLETILYAESDKSIQETIVVMIKTIRLALMTIGVPNKKLNEDSKNLAKIIVDKRDEYQNYKSFFEKDLKEFVNKNLIEILLEYLIDLDTNKIENLDLFDLLPRNFLNRLDQFKHDYITSTQFKDFVKEVLIEIEEYINPFTLSVKSKIFKLSGKIERSTQEYSPLKELEQPKMKFYYQGETRSFLDYFGNFPHVKSGIIKKFNIDTENLINSKDKTPEFFNLENLFYYVSILKMLNIKIPFEHDEIISITNDHIFGRIFSNFKYVEPDPISIFHSLAVFSELNILKNTPDVVNLFEIKNFIDAEIKDFLSEKLHLNFYTLLSIKMLENFGVKIPEKNLLLSKILNLNILTNLEESNLILDIFEHLACIRLLDKEVDISKFRKIYNAELKTSISSSGLSIKDTITDSAKALLIMDMFGLKNLESELIHTLISYIVSSTKFFTYENQSKEFNWENDILALTVELRMLFWGLLACSQYGYIT